MKRRSSENIPALSAKKFKIKWDMAPINDAEIKEPEIKTEKKKIQPKSELKKKIQPKSDAQPYSKEYSGVCIN